MILLKTIHWIVASLVLLSTSSFGNNFIVDVNNPINPSTIYPLNIYVNVNDTIEWHFFAGATPLQQSTYFRPCDLMAGSPWMSGNVPPIAAGKAYSTVLMPINFADDLYFSSISQCKQVSVHSLRLLSLTPG